MRQARRVFCLIPILCLVAMASCGRSTSDETSGASAFTKWAKGNGVRLSTVEPGSGFEDLHALGEMIGDAQVVCLGESRHDIHEQFRLKHRLIEYLVKTKDFTAVVFEEGLPYARKVDAYVLGGDEDPEELLNGMCNWYAWDTLEVLDLLRWMRSYNMDPATKRPVRFFGADVTAPKIGIENVLAYLDRVDPSYSADIRRKDLGLELLDDRMWMVGMQAYGDLTGEERAALISTFDGLVSHLEEMREVYISHSSPTEYEWMLRDAEVALAANRMYASGSRVEGGVIRDQAMAENLLWIMEHQVPGERIVFWAHNAHVSRCPIVMSGISDAPLEDMAYRLSPVLGDRLFTMGAVFGHGECPEGAPPGLEDLGTPDPDRFDGALAAAGIPILLLDLRGAPAGSPVAAWLAEEQTMRAQMGDMYLQPAAAYDAVYFVDVATRTRPTASALESFGRLQQ